MKKYLITVGIFILPIISVAISVELLLRYSPNDYNYKSNYMESHVADIECLILGNSHSAWGIAPNCFSFNTFNLAYAGQPLTYDEKLLRKYINELPKLRTLIMSISYVVPYCDYEHGKENWRAKTYPIYFNIKPDFDNWKYHFEITANSPRVILSRLQQLCNESELHCKVRGNYYATCLSSDEVLKKSRAAEGHNALYYRKDSLPIIYEKNYCCPIKTENAPKGIYNPLIHSNAMCASSKTSPPQSKRVSSGGGSDASARILSQSFSGLLKRL